MMFTTALLQYVCFLVENFTTFMSATHFFSKHVKAFCLKVLGKCKLYQKNSCVKTGLHLKHDHVFYPQYSSWMHSQKALNLTTYNNQSEVDISGLHENKEWGILEHPAWKTKK